MKISALCAQKTNISVNTYRTLMKVGSKQIGMGILKFLHLED